ncbi:MAG: EamA family transporter [Bacteroidota bacterium]
MGYLFIAATILFTVYGQLILKWRMNMKSNLPETGIQDVLWYYFHLFTDFYILSGIAAAFFASLFWMAAMTKFEISFAYPFMSLAPALVFILGIFLFDETFTIGKLIGLGLIIVGLIVMVKL